jgi:small-conductance mechanosensitive channel/CRP-like cAMP-binding protein
MNDVDWREAFGWAAAVVIAYPLLTLVSSELSRRLASREQSILGIVNAVRHLLLPAAAAWIIAHQLADLPPDGMAAKLIDTAAGTALLFTTYLAAKSVIALLTARTQAPRLLFDIALTVLVSVGAAGIVATVWGFSMASLLSAVGVGSLVMGLALQGVIGGMVNGLLVLSGNHFKIGDYVSAGGVSGRVVEIDWQSVSLQTSPSEVMVLPSATLASGSFSVSPGVQPSRLSVKLTLSCEYAPEAVRAMLIEAARGAPQLASPESSKCRVSELTPGGIVYDLSVQVANRAEIDAARDDILSRVWYVAQRRGISVSGDKALGNQLNRGVTPEERAELLGQSGALRRPASALVDLAAAASLQRWRVGELVLRQGDAAANALVVLRGGLRVHTDVNGARVDLERLGEGQLFCIREAFRSRPSPVTVEAAEDCELMSIPADALHQILNRDSGLAADVEILVEARAKALKNLRGDAAEQPASDGGSRTRQAA